MSMSDRDQLPPSFTCPLPLPESPCILLGHGSGGKLTGQLIDQIFLPQFANPYLNEKHDGAILPSPGFMPFSSSDHPPQMAMTTDSYVVNPLFFPGGDIGKLCIYGTVNDLSMCGATPLYISLGFILEEGLPLEILERIVHSIQLAAKETQVAIVTGDTKVVERGKGDGIFISTTGIGRLNTTHSPHPRTIKPGDCILVSGDLGRHGICILGQREGFQFDPPIESDCASLVPLVSSLYTAGIHPHALRDLTRGGLSSALNELASICQCDFIIDEKTIPIREDIRGACEILGLDPLYVACEGRMVAFVDPLDTQKALNILKSLSLGKKSRIIGTVKARSESSKGKVFLKTNLGSERILDTLIGDQLPRIC